MAKVTDINDRRRKKKSSAQLDADLASVIDAANGHGVDPLRMDDLQFANHVTSRILDAARATTDTQVKRSDVLAEVKRAIRLMERRSGGPAIG